ncbi:MAG: HAMP domain-containing histidine kinase [Candidatus Promineofilum sp.]|nr:HAMP domain-containing histidine kinase [Promineifilum sp.]MCW5863309.1 HAMP domain-containing histidine kinase [Anaerolineae bacterium]
MKHKQPSESAPEPEESDEVRRLRRELARANAKLERLQERKSSMLAMAAHDLRTPIAVIQGYAQLLELSLSAEADPTIREYLTTIVAHAASLRNGVENLVVLDAMDRGEVKIDAVRCDLVELVGQALAQVEGLISVKGVELTLDTPPEPLWVLADEDAAGRALYSLVSHAEKYARERGRLIITVVADGGYGRVSVSDPDRRLPAEVIARAFERVEIGPEGRAATRGTDLGLVVARKLAEAHGGRVAAGSTEAGTTLSLSLPRASEEPAEA